MELDESLEKPRAKCRRLHQENLAWPALLGLLSLTNYLKLWKEIKRSPLHRSFTESDLSAMLQNHHLEHLTFWMEVQDYFPLSVLDAALNTTTGTAAIIEQFGKEYGVPCEQSFDMNAARCHQDFLSSLNKHKSEMTETMQLTEVEEAFDPLKDVEDK
ncbi:unnamed protein product, partial [Porites evermanni]